MAFEELKKQIFEIQLHTEKAIKSNIDYYKLWFFKVVTKSVSELLKIVLIGFVAFLGVLFIAIAVAFSLGAYFENNAVGFLIVAGIFLLLLMVVYIFRKKIIEKPILSKMSDIYFKE